VSQTPSLCRGLVRTATLRVGGYRTPLGRLLVCGLLGILLACWERNARADPALSADIPAGPVAGALANFTRQTGLQLVYVSDIAKGRTSRGARVGTSPTQALTQLLAGTGLGYTFVNDRTVRIYVLAVAPETPRTLEKERAPRTEEPVEEVVVLASRGEEPVREVPISLAVWSSDAIAMTGAKNLQQVAAMTPAVEYDFDTAVGAGISTNLSIALRSSAGRRVRYWARVPRVAPCGCCCISRVWRISVGRRRSRPRPLITAGQVTKPALRLAVPLFATDWAFASARGIGEMVVTSTTWTPSTARSSTRTPTGR